VCSGFEDQGAPADWNVRSFVRFLDDYTNSAVESLNAHNRELAFASDDLRQVQEFVKTRYVFFMVS
jgi:hypothetical protein